jgi:hypothetical protein
MALSTPGVGRKTVACSKITEPAEGSYGGRAYLILEGMGLDLMSSDAEYLKAVAQDRGLRYLDPPTKSGAALATVRIAQSSQSMIADIVERLVWHLTKRLCARSLGTGLALAPNGTFATSVTRTRCGPPPCQPEPSRSPGVPTLMGSPH